MIRVVLAVCVALAMGGCKDEFESAYPTAKAAARAGAFDRGWVPVILYPDVTEIREWHDLDSNKVRGRFALNDENFRRMKASCIESQQKQPVDSAPAWWPHFTSDARLHVFRCDGFFVAVDQTNGVGAFWAGSR